MNEFILNEDDSPQEQLQRIKEECKESKKPILLFNFGKVDISIYGDFRAFAFKDCYFFIKISDDNNKILEYIRYSIEDKNLKDFAKRLQRHDLINNIPRNIIYHLKSLLRDDFNIKLYETNESIKNKNFF
jgi:hypothetical protein